MAHGDQACLPFCASERGGFVHASFESPRVLNVAREKNNVVHGEWDVGPANGQSIACCNVCVLKTFRKFAPNRDENGVGLQGLRRYLSLRLIRQVDSRNILHISPLKVPLSTRSRSRRIARFTLAPGSVKLTT